MLDRRVTPQERSKDILYLHDTILIFRDTLEGLREIWRGVVDTELTATIRRFQANIERYLSGPNDDVREAAAIARSLGRGSSARAETILAVCRQGLGTIFGK